MEKALVLATLHKAVTVSSLAMHNNNPVPQEDEALKAAQGEGPLGLLVPPLPVSTSAPEVRGVELERRFGRSLRSV